LYDTTNRFECSFVDKKNLAETVRFLYDFYAKRNVENSLSNDSPTPVRVKTVDTPPKPQPKIAEQKNITNNRAANNTKKSKTRKHPISVITSDSAGESENEMAIETKSPASLKRLTDQLDGEYYSKAIKRVKPTAKPDLWESQMDQKLIVRLSFINNLIVRIRCRSCGGALSMTKWLPNSLVAEACCAVCRICEQFTTCNLVRLKTLFLQRAVNDIPYLEIIAARLNPAGGSANNNRYGFVFVRCSLLDLPR